MMAVFIAARRPREKPMRSAEAEAERKDITGRWRRYPEDYFENKAHITIDNKKFERPTTDRAKRYSKMRRVRFHLRTKSEGLEKGFTKPNSQKHKLNPGGSVRVCAGIIKGTSTPLAFLACLLR